MSRTPPRSWSLTLRLGWRLSCVMLLSIMLAAAAMVWRTVVTVEDLDDASLQAQAQLVLGALPAVAGTARTLDLPEALLAPYRASDGDTMFLVYDATGGLAAASDPRAAAALAPFLPRPPRAGFFSLRVLPGRAHGLVGLIAVSGPWRVVVAQGNEQTSVLLASLLGNLLAAALWLLVPLGVATVLVGVLTLHWGLRPLLRASAAASLAGPARPGMRLPLTAMPHEIAPLVAAVNDALDRMEQGLAGQRQFMAEAAHALRTPLAVLTARLDLMDERPEACALRRDVGRMARLVGQLLRIARLEGLPLDVTQDVALRAVAVEAITDLAPLGLRRGIDLALQECLPGLRVRGNHAALVLALTNLLENALAHAPTGSAVEVMLSAPATFTVLDRGPGVAPEHRLRIFGRFARGTAVREGGAGLGLAIVAEIAAAHGGRAHAGPRPGGGSAFVLMLGRDTGAAGRNRTIPAAGLHSGDLEPLADIAAER